MTRVEPVIDAPAAIAHLKGKRVLLIADYHAGVEADVESVEGLTVPSQADDRREQLLELLTEHNIDKLIVLGDLVHSIGVPSGAERSELDTLFDALDIPVLVAKGNHDGVLESLIEDDPERYEQMTVTSTGGTVCGDIGLVHGHTWPAPELLERSVLCIGHEHPTIRLTDEVGGQRTERIWLRGALHHSPFEDVYEALPSTLPELIVFPAFNDLLGGTWVNQPEHEFLTPFLPEGLPNATVHLLDGTSLGSYRRLTPSR